MMAGKRADRDRRDRADGRSWCRPRGIVRAGELGQIARPLTFDGLALVGRHAERGVALEMLDRAEAFARGERDVRRRSRRSGNRRRPCRGCPRPARAASARAALVRRRRQRHGPARRSRSRAAAAAPAARPSARHAPSANAPVAAPATRHARRQRAGHERRERRRSSAACRRDGQVRCTVGFQPPDTASRSQAIRSVSPLASPTIDAAHAVRRRAPLRPCAPATIARAGCRAPLDARGDVAPRIDHARRLRRRRRRDRAPCASRRRCW